MSQLVKILESFYLLSVMFVYNFAQAMCWLWSMKVTTWHNRIQINHFSTLQTHKQDIATGSGTDRLNSSFVQTPEDYALRQTH